jgi:hypothetical protein
VNPTLLPAVTPTVFKAHFENFSMVSEKENLGFMEGKIDPQVQAKTELSGPPSLG